MLRSRSPSIALFFLFLASQWIATRATCFYPNGNTSPDLPCDVSSDASVCCSEGFYCLSNGLCQDPRYTNPLRLQRGACNNNSWPSPGCPTYCKAEYPGGDEAVFFCGNGKYCCNDETCCSSSDTIFLTLGAISMYATALQGGDPNIKTTAIPAAASAGTSAAQAQTTAADSGSSNSANAVSPSTTAAGTAATASASSDASQSSGVGTSNPTGTASAASKPTSNSASKTSNNPQQATVTVSAASSHKSNTTAIAVGVGVAGGILVLGLACLVIWLRRRPKHQKAGRARLQTPVEVEGTMRSEIDGQSGEGRLRDVLSWAKTKRKGRWKVGDTAVYELGADTKPVELDAGGGVHRGGQGAGDGRGGVQGIRMDGKAG